MAVWTEKFISPNQYSRPQKKMTAVRKIILHYTANNGATALNHYNYFNNLKGTYASAHFFVDKKDKLLIIPLTEIAYHANDVQQGTKANPWRGVKELLPNANFLSVGIEMCLEKDGTFHADTIKHAEEVAVELCKRYKLDPLEDIVRHYDVTRKNCPAPWVKDGAKFTAFKERVNKAFKGTGVTPVKPSTSKPDVDTTTAPTMPTVKEGMFDNADVKRLQTRLNEKGYKVSVDGDFGAGTKAQVIKFQKDNKLDADGIVGKATWAKLTEVKKPAPAKPKPTTKPKEPVVVKAPEVKDLNDGVYFRVIVGSFSTSAEARKRVSELKAKGIEAFVAPYDTPSKKLMFRVVAGTFDGRKNAEDAVADLAKLKFDAFLLAMKK